MENGDGVSQNQDVTEIFDEDRSLASQEWGGTRDGWLLPPSPDWRLLRRLHVPSLHDRFPSHNRGLASEAA